MTRTRVSLLASGAALTLAISIVSTASAVTRNGWSNVGSNGQPSAPDGALNARVHAIAVSGTDVYVGGMFTGTAGLNGAGSIAKWDGSSWSTMPNSLGGGALNGRVNAILVDGSSVFVGGYFQNAGGDPQADYLAVWNGSTWSDIDGATTGDGALAGEVHSLAKHDSNLYVGGTFFNAPVFGDVSGNAGDNIVRWDGTWHEVGQRSNGDGALQASVYALIATADGVIAGGGFKDAADTEADFLAEYDLGANTWAPFLGSDSTFNEASFSSVNALYMDGDQLFVGGTFTDFAGISTADYLVHRSGGGWEAPGGANGTSAIRAPVYSIVGDGTDVYVGGDFVNAGVGTAQNATADRVAKWNGIAWSGLGGNGSGDGALNTNPDGQGWVRALGLVANSLIVGGSFLNAATIAEADFIASFSPPPPASPKPDGRIRKGTGALVGNNIYNGTGANQTRTGQAAIGNTITFTISIQNDGTGAGAFNVGAAGAAASGYQVTYWRGTTNISAAVVNGTYQTISLAPGGTLAIKAKVKVLAGAGAGSSVTRLVTISSVVNPSSVDAVRFVGKRS